MCEHCPIDGDESKCISCHRDRLDSQENADAGYYDPNPKYAVWVGGCCLIGFGLCVVVAAVCGAINITWRAGQ